MQRQIGRVSLWIVAKSDAHHGNFVCSFFFFLREIMARDYGEDNLFTWGGANPVYDLLLNGCWQVIYFLCPGL
jgi:hypothetical protein